MSLSIAQFEPVTLQTPIGIVGLGVMGSGIARSLARAGFQVFAYSRSLAKADSLRAGGLAPASLAELGDRCRVVVLSLPDTAAVEAVVMSADGLLNTLSPGACIVDTSTISAVATRTIAEALAARGIAYLDAPVSGGEKAAADGTLSCMVGGDAAAFQSCNAVFDAIARSVVHMGAAGTGQITKACNQMAVSAALLGVAEALALARRQGVDPVKVREVLMGGAAMSFSLDKHGQRIIDGSFAPGFRAVLMRKDLRLALDAGRAGASFMPVAALAAQLLDVMCNRGDGDLDWSALGALVAEHSGVPIGSDA